MHTSEGQNIGLKRRRHETPVKANGVLLICNEVTGNEELYASLYIYRHLHKYILSIVSQHLTQLQTFLAVNLVDIENL